MILGFLSWSLLGILLGLIATLIWAIVMILTKRKFDEVTLILAESKEKLKNSQRDIEAEKRDALLKIKDEIHKKRQDFETEIKRGRADLDRLHSKLNEKFESLEKREMAFDELRNELQQKERRLLRMDDALRADEAKIKTMYTDLTVKLERISNLTKDEARALLLESLEAEVKMSNQKMDCQS